MVCVGELEIWIGALPLRLLRSVPIEEGEVLTVTWKHSFQHFQWREAFQVKPGASLSLLSSATDGYGAGTPDCQREAGTFRIE